MLPTLLVIHRNDPCGQAVSFGATGGFSEELPEGTVRTSLSPQRGEGLRVRGGDDCGVDEAGAFVLFSPLTPALSPLRGS